MFGRPAALEAWRVLPALWLALHGAGCCLLSSGGTLPTGMSGDGTPAPGPLRAGAAAVEIALPNGPSLAGFGSTPRRIGGAEMLLTGGPVFGACLDPDPGTAAVFFTPALGTLDPLRARALVLDTGTRTLAIVTLDAIGMSRRLRADVAQAAGALGIAPPFLLMAATHTHSGPGGASDEIAYQILASDCFAPTVYAALRAAAVQALTLAHAALQPAELGVGAATLTGLARNRTGAPELDETLTLLKLVTPAGVPIAALFHFAVHGTWFGASNLHLSADLAGAMEQAVEASVPVPVAIYLNGAEGDVSPNKAAFATLAAAGAAVGTAVQGLWPTVPTASSADLRAVLAEVAMPPPAYNPAGCLPLAQSTLTLCDLLPGGDPLTVALPASWVPETLPVQAVRINETVLVALPGEPVTALGLELKQYATGLALTHGVVVGLANDHGGYFTTPAQYDQGEYEGQATIYGRDTGVFIVDQARQVMDQVQ